MSIPTFWKTPSIIVKKNYRVEVNGIERRVKNINQDDRWNSTKTYIRHLHYVNFFFILNLLLMFIILIYIYILMLIYILNHLLFYKTLPLSRMITVTSESKSFNPLFIPGIFMCITKFFKDFFFVFLTIFLKWLNNVIIFLIWNSYFQIGP